MDLLQIHFFVLRESTGGGSGQALMGAPAGFLQTLGGWRLQLAGQWGKAGSHSSHLPPTVWPALLTWDTGSLGHCSQVARTQQEGLCSICPPNALCSGPITPEATLRRRCFEQLAKAMEETSPMEIKSCGP